MSQLQRLVIAASQIHDSQIHLTPEQQHYLFRVLRLKSNDRFIAIDGTGHGWISQLQSDASNPVAVLLEPIAFASELPIPITLLLALPKNGFDDVVRQVTELGVSCIVPVISERTVLKPSSNKLDRWQRIAQEASEQSERQWVPTVQEPIAFSEALKTIDAERKFICTARGNPEHLLDRLLNSETASSIAVAIGCEGGWTDREIARAIEAGYQAVSLGRRILRAVTAPIAALSLIAGTIECRNREPSE